MTGNTWDWTSSLFRPYRYDPGDSREEPLSGDGRLNVPGVRSVSVFGPHLLNLCSLNAA